MSRVRCYRLEFLTYTRSWFVMCRGDSNNDQSLLELELATNGHLNRRTETVHRHEMGLPCDFARDNHFGADDVWSPQASSLQLPELGCQRPDFRDITDPILGAGGWLKTEGLNIVSPETTDTN